MYVNNVNRSAEFLLHMVENLLDVSVIESGNPHLNRSQIDPGDLVSDAVRLNGPVGEAKGIALEARLPEAGPVMEVDGPKLEQVLNNLITNAIKFSPGGTRVQVDLREAAGQVVLSVMDQGRGIPERELGRLFRPFGKTSVRTAGGERSTGLGLAIVNRIVVAHGGSIKVESEVGRGSTFTVALTRG